MDLKKALEKRHSTRSFKLGKKAKLKDIFYTLESTLNAPMAGDIYSLRFIVVDEGNKITEIAEAAPHNEFLADASHLIIVCSDLKQTERMYGLKGKEEYARYQAGAAIENMLLRITDLGLNSCWIGSFDEPALKRILTIPSDIRVDAILPVGYELRKEGKKVKTLLKNLLSYNHYGNKNW